MYIMSPALPLQLHHYTGVEDTALHLGFTVAVPAAAAVGGEVHDTGASSRCTGGCRRDGPGSIVSAQPPPTPSSSVSQSVSHRAARAGHPARTQPRHQWPASLVGSSLFFSLFLSLYFAISSWWWCFGCRAHLPSTPLLGSPLLCRDWLFFPARALPSATTMLPRQTSLCNRSAPFLNPLHPLLLLLLFLSLSLSLSSTLFLLAPTRQVLYFHRTESSATPAPAQLSRNPHVHQLTTRADPRVLGQANYFHAETGTSLTKKRNL